MTTNKVNLEKIVVNVGAGRLSQHSQFKDKIMPELMKELSIITGQKPAPRKAKKAISNFKTRTGDIIGFKVTLRGKRMHDFFTRLIALVFPRVKDFRGIDVKNVDTNGNLNVGFREQFVFPEINIEKSSVNFGVQITFVPKIKERENAIAMYRSSGVPLKK